MSLIGDREKCVRLFVDGLLGGNITIDLANSHDMNKFGKISKALASYAINFDKIKDTDKYKETVNEIYAFFVSGRIMNDVKGELRDRDEEEQIPQLREENKKLKEENTKLKNDNTILANELEDQKNLINSYEKSTLEKK